MSTTETQPSVRGDVRMLIDGKLVEATSGKTFDNINPATEEVLGPTTDASVEDMREAIAAARRAFDETDWSTNRALRKRCLVQLQEALTDEKEQLRAQIVAEVGCPVGTSFAQVDMPLDGELTWPAEMIDRFAWEEDRLGDLMGMTTCRRIQKLPAGVVGAIVPWNFPFQVTIAKVGQALATGNTMIIKPAPDTPWNATHLGRIVAERTDIPPGVLNVVTSSDHLVGEELVIDPRVDMISFTGSTATGRRIMERGAPTLKRLFLELGGKSAFIVLDDVDFPEVMPRAAGICSFAGQVCAATSRWLVPRARYDEAIELMTPAFKAVKYGNPLEPGVTQGPQISAKQRDRVIGYVEKGVAEGARIVTGGGRPADQPKGYFVEPTLFADVDNSMTIAREEIFGPVLVVIPFEDDDDAVRIANDSDYGLSGAVTSASDDRAYAVANRIRTGTINVNRGAFYGPDVPFGGFKASGIGRQCGVEGFEQYLETRTMGIPST